MADEMTAKDYESVLLARCDAIMRNVSQSDRNQCKANVIRLASMLIQSQYPEQARRLIHVSGR